MRFGGKKMEPGQGNQKLKSRYQAIVSRHADMLDISVGGCVSHRGRDLEIPVVKFGAQDPKAPCLAFVSGVHGLEKIGVDVVLTLLQAFASLSTWDCQFKEALRCFRLVFYPFANPVGLENDTRCNGNGVDLMRNAAIDCAEARWYQLYAGHRLSGRLPWYRGKEGNGLERELAVLQDVMERDVLTSEFAVCVDFHSGFGSRDRLWFPFAHSRQPFPDISWLFLLKSLFKQSFPHHVYRIEPQSHAYCAHGDFWDFLYLRNGSRADSGTFLPLTLEMGSWLWLKKNPRQILAPLGTFNPVIPHRRERTLRRHWLLADFLARFVSSFRQLDRIHAAELPELDRKARLHWPREGRRKRG